MTDRPDLPDALRLICQQVRKAGPPDFDSCELADAWAAHIAQARREVPEIQVEDGGELLALGALSPGCVTCKQGTWDCLFLTMRCNLNCGFCFSPHAIPADYTGSIYGATPEQIAADHDRIHIDGISFSGGEVFTDMPKLTTWLAWFRDHRPEAYYWIYTNGLLAGPDRVQALADLGLDEIRFNMAATGYDHPRVMHNLTAAARCIPNITVEIPAIPADADKLLDSLAKWVDAGVRFLNLHELIYEPGSRSDTLDGPRRAVTMPDGHRTAIHPASRHLTLAVMKRVQAEGLPLSVNDCSLHSKARQLRGRRRNVALLVKAPHEKLVDDVRYESCCAYRGEDVRFIHPDTLPQARRQYADYQFVRVARIAPLSLDEPSRWVEFTFL